MDEVRKARLLLGLPEEFGHVELDAAYRRSAAALRQVPQARHGDLPRDLNDARDRLRERLGPRPGTDLVRRQVMTIAPSRALPAGELERRVAASDRAVKAAVTQSIGRLARVRQQRFTVGLATAAVAAVGVFIRVTVSFGARLSEGTLTSSSNEDALAVISGVCAVVAALFGVLGWATKGRQRYLEMQVEGIADG